jgi:hypothetical protein
VYAFDLQPPTATNELGTDDSHTVTATVSGEPGTLADWPVSFGVVAGPNAATTGICSPVTCATDATGAVTFTYTVPQVPASLGTDTIEATVNINGDTATLQVSKEWQDTTPPVAQCVASVNPAGTIPVAPGHGQSQNPDGFYKLLATDDIWPLESLSTFVVDTGTATVFGPFAVGTDIKYTEANGAQPSIKPGSGQVEWNIKGQGDAAFYAVDGSGNQSTPVSCLVPPTPQ